MDDLNLRDANIHDLEPITKLIIKCSEQFILPQLSDEGRKNYFESHSLEKMRERLKTFSYQVIEERNKIIGIVGVKRPSHLYHLHVDSNYHKNGIGRRLWVAALERALSSDHPSQFTVNSSTYAVSFYEKLGFVASQAEVQGGVEYVPMSMDLAAKNTALLIVDVQGGAFDGLKTPPVINDKPFIKNIRNLSTSFREKNFPVIYIQDCGKVGGAFEQGTDQWEIHPEITPQKNDIVILKATSNAFYETPLKETLNNLGVKTLVVCGLHSEGCFFATCNEALSQGFKTIVVADGHATAQENYSEIIEGKNSELKSKGAFVEPVKSLVGREW